jgi:hypothetical protein
MSASECIEIKEVIQFLHGNESPELIAETFIPSINVY